MRPRLTPSTGISTLRASSAARRNVPSPPRTRTSSQPSAARSSASTTSISTPRARMSSGARCTGPRSTASAESTRSPMPLSPSTFSTRRAVSVASSRPVCTTSRMVRSHVIAAPPRRRWRTACSSAFARAADCRSRPAGAGSTRRCPTDPGSGLAVTPTVCHRSSAARRATASTASARSCGSDTTPPAPTRSLPTSNCGFTMGTISASPDAHEVSAGSTVASEMNDRSATTRSTGPPIASAVSSRTLVRSSTVTRIVVTAVTRPAGRSRRRRRPPRGRRGPAAPR